MSKNYRIALSALVAFTLVGAGATQAQARSINLTYDQFIVSAGYQALQAADETSANFYQSQSGVEIGATISGSIDAMSFGTGTIEIQATRTAVKTTIVVPNPRNPGNLTLVSGYDRGVGYDVAQSLKTFDDIPNGTLALNALNGDYHSTLILDDPQFAAGLTTQPSDYFDTTGITDIGIDSTTLQKMLFSAVEITHNQADNSTTYSFDSFLAGVGISPKTVVSTDETFDQNGALKSVGMYGVSGGSDEYVNITVAPNNALTIQPLDLSKTIKLSLLVKTGKQISARNILTPKANAIAAKAKALASKAKKPIDLAKILDAAKALKYRVTRLSNGVKLTYVYDDVPGSKCVIAVSKHAVVKDC
ncbi:MAG: hypothetical protein RJA35_136 [Actinomycetota bacterium]|jgi:hypothetical protein